MRANAKPLALYFRQLHSLLHAGVSLSFALSTLGLQAPSAALRCASREMATHIEAGGSWNEAMRAHPVLFSDLSRAIVEAGKSSGGLSAACLNLAEAAEREYEIYQIIKRETWYPKLLLFFSLFLVPLPLRLGSFQFSALNQIIFIGLVWGVWKVANYAWPFAARSEMGLRIDCFRLQIPLVGKVVRGFAVARFCRVLGLCCAAGIEVPRGVLLGAAACGNRAIGAKFQPVSARVSQGNALAASLAATGEMPALARSLVASGEISGELNAQLQAAAHFLESDAETALQQAVQAFNLLVFLLVALKIATQVIQYWAR